MVPLLIGYSASQSTQDPSFGLYNMLMCRPGQIASFPLNSSISKSGLIVAMDIYPHPSGSSTQTIFSIRNTETNYISLRCDYFRDSGALNIWINPVGGTPYYVYSSSPPIINKGKHSKEIILRIAEIV